MKIFSEQEGFTLIETLVAVAILTIGILTLCTMQVSAIRGNSAARQVTTAASVGANQIEDVFTRSYDTYNDTDGDSLGGLYHFTAATADGVATTPDGSYTIFWNVAPEEPMPNTKRVVVNVVNAVNSRSVEYEYIVARNVQK